MIWAISWKNVWRNKKRSLIVICAVLLGTIAGVFTSGIMKGWVKQRIETVIYTEFSHIKIHNPDYLLNEEIGYTIPNSETVEQFLRNNTKIKAYTKRTRLMVMANTSRGNTALLLQGINIEDEKSVSKLYTKIVEGGGNYFESKLTNPIIISDKTAESLRIKNYQITKQVIDSLVKLEVPEFVIEKIAALEGERFKTEKLYKTALKKILTKKEDKKYGKTILTTSVHYQLRNKIILTINDSEGRLVYQNFKVCGIYKTDDTMFDQMNAFVLKEDLASLTGFNNNNYHELAMIINKDADIDKLKTEIKSAFPGLSALTWKDLSPDSALMSEFMDIWYIVIMGIILFALAFGIVNTMMMAILERIKELGMLMSIGMNKKRVFRMIMLETIFLTMVGAIAGMALGALLILITNHTGLNFSSVSEGMEALGYSSIIYPEIDAGFFFTVSLLVVLTGILASIPPARKALKLNPVEAIKIE